MTRNQEDILFSVYVIFAAISLFLVFLYGNLIVNFAALIFLMLTWRYDLHTRLLKFAWMIFVFLFIRGKQIYNFIRKPRKINLPIAKPVVTVGALLSQRRKYNEFYASTKPKIKLSVGRNQKHILIAGMTGSGKTNLINQMLIQLFAQGDQFREQFEVYILDLKPGQIRSDYEVWKTLCDGFHYIDEDGEDHAIQLLRLIEGRRTAKNILCVIDEPATIGDSFQNRDNKRDATGLIQSIARTLRSKGTFVMATQYPNFKSTGSVLTRGQFGIRIAFNMEADQLKVSTGHRVEPPSKIGDFVAVIDGKVRRGSTMYISKKECELAIAKARNLPVDLTDIRYVILQALMASRTVGDITPGVNQLYKSLRLPAADVRDWARRFEEWGILEPAPGNTRRIAMSPDEAAALVIGKHGEEK